jgi:hypothetical protein
MPTELIPPEPIQERRSHRRDVCDPLYGVIPSILNEAKIQPVHTLGKKQKFTVWD